MADWAVGIDGTNQFPVFQVYLGNLVDVLVAAVEIFPVVGQIPEAGFHAFDFELFDEVAV